MDHRFRAFLIRIFSDTYLHHSVLIRAVNGQIFYIGLVARNRVALVVLGDESLSVLASESRIAQRVGRIVRI